MCTPIDIGHPISARTPIEEQAYEAQQMSCTQCGAKNYLLLSFVGFSKWMCAYCGSDK